MQTTQIFIIIITTRSVQLQHPAVAICRQNERSSASCRASVTGYRVVQNDDGEILFGAIG